jgi:tetratricopeptide (TPR) repeat protein
MLQFAYAAYTRIGEHKAAIRVADELVKFDPASYDYRFMRGSASENAKDYKAALANYISTLDLFPDLSNVDGSQFYQVSTMYDKLGKPCDAISPLETYISYNVKERQTQQIAKLISDYSRKGNCTATYANGSARVVIAPGNLIDVIINGSRARMIIDTRASLVSVTPEMAARARITPDASDLVEVKVVGGLLKLGHRLCTNPASRGGDGRKRAGSYCDWEQGCIWSGNRRPARNEFPLSIYGRLFSGTA